MSHKRLKFLWLDFPIPPDKWEPKRGEMGDSGYDKLTPREKRLADNFSICDQRDTFLEDAYLSIARAFIFIARILAVFLLIFALTFGYQMLHTARSMYGITDVTQNK